MIITTPTSGVLTMAAEQMKKLCLTMGRSRHDQHRNGDNRNLEIGQHGGGNAFVIGGFIVTRARWCLQGAWPQNDGMAPQVTDDVQEN